MILKLKGMSKYKCIIIILSFSIFFKCAPSKHIRYKNSDIAGTNHTSNDLFFNWISDENEYQHDDIDAPDKDEYNHHSVRNKRPYLNSSEAGNNKKYYTKNANKNAGNENFQEIKNHNETDSEDKKRLKYKIYTVKKGDNLTNISKKNNTSLEEITRINKIKNINTLFEGMKIKVPLNREPENFEAKKINNKKDPSFTWPIKNVYETKRDGTDGVKSIGIVIISELHSAVLSSAGGTVIRIGSMRGFGKYVILKHSNKFLTIYSNLKDVKVNEGDSIKSGEYIGRLEGNRLHFQIGHSGKPEDPLSHLYRKS